MLGAHATLNAFGLTSARASAATRPIMAFAGEGSWVENDGVNLLNGHQHAQYRRCSLSGGAPLVSREVFRAVVDDRGSFGVPGPIVVRPDAQKTDATDDHAGRCCSPTKPRPTTSRSSKSSLTTSPRRWRDYRRARRGACRLLARPWPSREGSAGAARFRPSSGRRSYRSSMTICASSRYQRRSAGWRRGDEARIRVVFSRAPMTSRARGATPRRWR